MRGFIWLYAHVLDVESTTLDFVKEPGLTAFNILNDSIQGIHSFCLAFETVGGTHFSFSFAPPKEVILGIQQQLKEGSKE